MSIVLLCAMSVLMMSDATTQPGWQTIDQGELILRSFENAPFPHPSRKDGWKYQETFYPADKHYSDSTIGIFIPKTFKPSEKVDIVVHFHGWGNNVAKVISQFDLPNQMIKSGKNAILLVPQGPKDASDSGSGKMEDEGGFERMIREVVAFLHAEGKLPAENIGKIVIGGHSGGYKAMGFICKHGGLRENITDVICYDATYGQLDLFADWCKLGGNRRLVSIFTEHLASENFQLMTLLKKRDVKFDYMLEADMTQDRLMQRCPIIIHTLELSHNDVLAKKDYFGLWVGTSGISSPVE